MAYYVYVKFITYFCLIKIIGEISSESPMAHVNCALYVTKSSLSKYLTNSCKNIKKTENLSTNKLSDRLHEW